MIVMGEESFLQDCGFMVSKIILLNYYLKDLNTYDFEWSSNSKQILFKLLKNLADANYLDRSIYQVRALAEPQENYLKLQESSQACLYLQMLTSLLSSVSANDPLAQSIFISNFNHQSQY